MEPRRAIRILRVELSANLHILVFHTKQVACLDIGKQRCFDSLIDAPVGGEDGLTNPHGIVTGRGALVKVDSGEGVSCASDDRILISMVDFSINHYFTRTFLPL